MNFKREVAKRFKKSQITEYKFPKKDSSSTNNETRSTEGHAASTESTARYKILDQWNTIS